MWCFWKITVYSHYYNHNFKSCNFRNWKSYGDSDEGRSQKAFKPLRMPGLQTEPGSMNTRAHVAKHYSCAMDFFKLFFTSQLVVQLCAFTNLYAQLNAKKSYAWVDIDENEMYKFMALLIYMGFIKFPNIESYWSVSSLFHGSWARRLISSRDRFKSILCYLHVVDSLQEQKDDRLHKVRFLIDYIRAKCFQLYQPGLRICIDERMVRCKSRFNMRQYCKDKPVKFGFKLWVLADSLNAYTYDFNIYRGKVGTPVSKNGLAYDVVFELMSSLLHQGYELYMDNFYSSPQLFLDLLSCKTFACGTTAENRRGYPKELKSGKKQWGKSSQRGDCRWVRVNNMLALQWKDSKVVSALSTVHKGNQVTQCKRRSKGQDGKYHCLTLTQPRAISDYNKYMKGVDQSDQLLSNYSILRKADKYWKTLFYHTIDIAVVNAYVLFQETRAKYPDVPELQRPVGYGQLEFREELVRQLGGVEEREDIPLGKHNHPPKRKRESENRCGGHPDWSDTRRYCTVCYKMKRVQNRTFIMCDRCGGYYCLQRERNCFKNHLG